MGDGATVTKQSGGWPYPYIGVAKELEIRPAEIGDAWTIISILTSWQYINRLFSVCPN